MCSFRLSRAFSAAGYKPHQTTCEGVITVLWTAMIDVTEMTHRWVVLGDLGRCMVSDGSARGHLASAKSCDHEAASLTKPCHCLSPHQETSRLQRARDGRVSKHTGREQHTVPLSTAAGAGSLQPGDTNETTQAITNPSFGVIHCAHAYASSWTGDNRPEGRYQVSDDRKVRSM